MSDENTQSTNNQGSNAHIYYIIGAVVLVAVIAVGYFLRPQQAITPVTTADGGGQAAGVAIEVGEEAPPATPITALGCERQYYNPVVGVAGEYYLSVEGVATNDATSVTCTIVAEVDEQEVARQSVDTTLVPSPERGGKTFRCSTNGLALEPVIPTKVDVELTDDQGNTAACFRYFNLP